MIVPDIRIRKKVIPLQNRNKSPNPTNKKFTENAPAVKTFTLLTFKYLNLPILRRFPPAVISMGYNNLHSMRFNASQCHLQALITH